jgi:hypothetical protein
MAVIVPMATHSCAPVHLGSQGRSVNTVSFSNRQLNLLVHAYISMRLLNINQEAAVRSITFIARVVAIVFSIHLLNRNFLAESAPVRTETIQSNPQSPRVKLIWVATFSSTPLVKL